jgi:hypothetical protein
VCADAAGALTGRVELIGAPAATLVLVLVGAGGVDTGRADPAEAPHPDTTITDDATTA